MKGGSNTNFKGKPHLELLRGVSGAFRPGVMTSLMGVSGAGKTTLMDVLAGRKTSMPLVQHLMLTSCHTAAVTCCKIYGELLLQPYNLTFMKLELLHSLAYSTVMSLVTGAIVVAT